MSKFSNDQLDSMVIVGHTDQYGKAWWGGGHFSGRVPFDEAVRLLDWTPAEYPVLVDLPMHLNDDGSDIVGGATPIPGRKAIVNPNTNKVLGIFSDGYTPHPYREALLDNLAVILDAAAGDLDIGSVGCLGNGEQAWVQVRPAEGVTVGGDALLPWLCAYSSLDGSLATSYKPVITRIVCDNTLSMADSERKQRYRIKHTRFSRLKVAEAREIIGIMWAQADDFVGEVERLQATTVTDAQFGKVLDIIAPRAEDGASARATTMANTKRDELVGLYRHDMRVAPFAGTAWGVLQAANTWGHHKANVRNVSRTDRQALNTITGRVDQADAEVLAALDKVLAAV